MNDISYLKLVEETLIKKWSNYKQPLKMNEQDLKAGMALLTRIALESDHVKTTRSIKKRVSTDTEPLDESVVKIKTFVKKNAFAFRQTCDTGFPFSLLESPSTKDALRRALKRDDSILLYFIKLEGPNSWTEEDLNQRFGDAFQHIQIREIAIACFDLNRAFLKGDHQAGYYFLWLLKLTAGCAYEIPEKESFNDATVTEVLSRFFTGSCLPKKTVNFVEILLYRGTRLNKHLYKSCLDQKSRSVFLDFALKQLHDMPMDKWPSKGNIITELLETENTQNKVAMAEVLVTSTDFATSEVGIHLLEALKANSLREAIPHFYALTELLPHINKTHFEISFGRPFIEFRHDRSIYKTDPQFTKRLNFNARREVFVCGSLMIGVYDSRTSFGDKEAPPHLLAYDTNTEKMVWGIPATSAKNLNLEKVGEHLALQFVEEKKLHFIRPETGETDSMIELPEVSKDLHVSSEGFAYQMVERDQDRVLIGGKIIDEQWITTFESKTPAGLFHPLSTHCGFFYPIKKSLILFGPTGDQFSIQHCIAAQAKDDMLYTIEKDNDKCFLTTRILRTDCKVVSDVQKRILLNAKEVSFGNHFHNGQLILFSGFSYTSPVFVDLKTEKVTYSTHKFSLDKHIINGDTGELWTWDEALNNIWKVSADNISLMGSLKSGRGTTLLHVDSNYLYFVNIPY